MIFNILAVGLMGTAMALSPMQPRYVVDNQNDTITFTAEELNNNYYLNLKNQLELIEDNNAAQTLLENTNITYNGYTYNYEDSSLETNQLFYLEDRQNLTHVIYLNWDSQNGAKFILQNSNQEEINFETSMTINNAEWFIANIEEPPSLTLSKYDLNNKSYTYLASQMVELQPFLGNTSITYNNNTYEYDDLAEGLLGYYYEQNETYIYFVYDTNESNYEVGKWIYWTSDEVNTPFTTSITINNAQWFIQNINAPLDSGDMMTAITSGLPLMANLAQAFLNGFTSIFWNSTTNTLTTFSNFALIMLSVAIVFACIKLVLNIVRSNTGV